MAKHWWHMENGQQRKELEFCAFIRTETNTEIEVRFRVPNLPIYDGNPDSFKRLSFEGIKRVIASTGECEIGYLIWGEVTEVGGGSVRDTYVFRRGARVPFATIRPSVFR